MTKNINQKIIEYCLKINIDPDVLLKQKAEIEMLLMKNDLLQEENKKLKESEVWHFLKDGDYPKEYEDILLCFVDETDEAGTDCVRGWYEYDFDNDKHIFKYINLIGTQYLEDCVFAWKKLILPEVK